MVKQFVIGKNQFLKDQDVAAWYSMPYTAVRTNEPTGTSHFLNVLKNNFGNVEWSHNKRSADELEVARKELERVLRHDLPSIREQVGEDLCAVCVPRSKASFADSQQQFRATIAKVTGSLAGFSDLTSAIKRVVDTKTTHWRNAPSDLNSGDTPYPGIALKTCELSGDLRDKAVLLIDDVYTPGIGIDEDFLQACIENGVRKIYFYAVAKTGG